jgi:hypothetical protein
MRPIMVDMRAGLTARICSVWALLSTRNPESEAGIKMGLGLRTNVSSFHGLPPLLFGFDAVAGGGLPNGRIARFV